MPLSQEHYIVKTDDDVLRNEYQKLLQERQEKHGDQRDACVEDDDSRNDDKAVEQSRMNKFGDKLEIPAFRQKQTEARSTSATPIGQPYNHPSIIPREGKQQQQQQQQQRRHDEDANLKAFNVKEKRRDENKETMNLGNSVYGQPGKETLKRYYQQQQQQQQQEQQRQRQREQV